MEILASRTLIEPRDFEASLAFYEGTLGLHRFREFGAPPHRGIVLFLGGGYLELLETGADHPPPPASIRLWLQVRDVGEAVEQVRGAWPDAVTSEAESKPWGLIQANVSDPDGLTLVLVEIPDDHPMRRDSRTL